MSLVNTIPKDSKLCVIAAVFKAVLNSPTIGYYDFTRYTDVNGNRGNVAVPLGIAMNPNFLYFFHQMQFSLSIDEGEFLKAIVVESFPSLAVRDSTTQKNIFFAPFRLFRYFENSAVDSYHVNQNQNAEMIADFQGLLQQTPDLIGITEVFAQVSFSVYEIRDQAFIENYKRGKI